MQQPDLDSQENQHATLTDTSEDQESPAAYQQARVREIYAYLTSRLERRISQKQLAQEFHISLTALKQTFRALYGMPMDSCLRHQRMALAKELLRETDLPISEIAGRVGYESHSQFTAAFRSQERQTPVQYRSRFREQNCPIQTDKKPIQTAKSPKG